MATQKATYKLSLTGGDVTVKDREISEDLARSIINLFMGGALVSPAAAPALLPPGAGAGAAGQMPPIDLQLSPKAFMAQKKPQSFVERVTCLAYYLAKFRDTPNFKAPEITKLNVDAAQPRFSSVSVFLRHASDKNYLTKAGKGAKQITAFGESIVEALPDREKVNAVIAADGIKARKRQKKKKS